MKVVFITEDDILYGNNNYLKSIFCVSKEDKKNGCIADIWVDCDFAKINNEVIDFVDHKTKTIQYVVLNDCNSEYIEMLSKFFQEDFEKYLNKDNYLTWSDWDKIKNGIAYRGGMGDIYALWEYNIN